MITISVTLTFDQLEKIKQIVTEEQITEMKSIIDSSQTTEPGFTRPTEMKPPVDIAKGESVSTRKVGGKKGPTMPGLGRSPEQIQAYAESEEARTIELDEEAEAKAQRREERERKKLEKEAEEKAKKAEEQKELEEIEKIKKANEAQENKTSTLAKKPWEK